jgi:hypothetical protein
MTDEAQVDLDELERLHAEATAGPCRGAWRGCGGPCWGYWEGDAVRHGGKIRRFLLRLALGRRTYAYLCRSLAQDPRLPRAYMADIIVRKDGRERRIEADWLKKLARICGPDLPCTGRADALEEADHALDFVPLHADPLECQRVIRALKEKP